MNLAIKGIRCKIHFLISAHHQFLSFIRMSVICYPHKPPLSTKQVAKLNFLKILMTFLLQNRSKNFLPLLIQVLLILPNLWILGFAMSFPQVKKYGGGASLHILFITLLEVQTITSRVLSSKTGQEKSWLEGKLLPQF